MKIKHFMDIQRIREQADEGTASNIGGFSVGDHIVIQEKVDGANASIRYDRETGKLAGFSRNQQPLTTRHLRDSGATFRRFRQRSTERRNPMPFLANG